jgi:hypothetical protein
MLMVVVACVQVGSGFVLVCYLALARPGRNPLASLVAFLTAADFGWAATNLASLATMLLGDRLELFSWSACAVFRGLFQFFAGAVRSPVLSCVCACVCACACACA